MTTQNRSGLNFFKLSQFILLAGIAVLLFGGFKYLTNQPITSKPNTTGNVFKDINIAAEQMINNNERVHERESAKQIMIIGGIIIFVGGAVRASTKN